MGVFGENFPYTNFHNLNTDWIIKIAKDFLDQYTHIQEIISDGETSLEQKTQLGIHELETTKEHLENLLNQWYQTHSQDIAQELTDALRDLNTALVNAVESFDTSATNKALEVIASIPADYTDLTDKVNQMSVGPGLVTSTEIYTGWNNGYYYNLASSQTNVDILNPTTSTSLACIVVPCSPGDIFHVTGVSMSAGRLWAFLASNGDIITRAGSGESGTNKKLTAPVNSAYLVCNAKTAEAHCIFKGLTFEEKQEANDVIYSLPVTTCSIKDNIIIFPKLVSGSYYGNTNGDIHASEEYSRSETLFRVPVEISGKIIVTDTELNNIYIACYNPSKEFIDYARPIKYPWTSSMPRAIPNNTEYIGLSIQNPNTNTVSLRILETPDVIEYPFTDKNILYRENAYWSHTTIGESEATCLAVFSVKPGQKFYSNAVSGYGITFRDWDGTEISSGGTEIGTTGIICTVPNSACIGTMTLLKNRQHDEQYAECVYRITSDLKILCIGDSVTYLDGQRNSSYDNASLFRGYQKQLEKAGIQTNSIGVSGATLAEGVISGGSNIGSLYTTIVTNQFNVSGYDIIIIEGGLNDDLYNVNIGTIPSDYDHAPTVNERKTTLGGLLGIIRYIRTNNPRAKIIVCTPLKSESTRRPYTEAVQYADGIYEMAKYAGCMICNLFEDMNISPFTNNFSEYMYDTTHPNYNGMITIGKLLLSKIKQYE